MQCHFFLFPLVPHFFNQSNKSTNYCICPEQFLIFVWNNHSWTYLSMFVGVKDSHGRSYTFVCNLETEMKILSSSNTFSTNLRAHKMVGSLLTVFVDVTVSDHLAGSRSKQYFLCTMKIYALKQWIIIIANWLGAWQHTSGMV